MITVEQARSFLLKHTRPIAEVEKIEVTRGLGRVLAEDILSPINVPGYDNSAMDGYAIRTDDIAADRETCLTIGQRIAAGEGGRYPLLPGQAARIFTGAPLPDNADAVVMQERCRVEGELVYIPAHISPGTNVRPRGNDIRTGDVVLAAGARLRPQELGLIASIGLSTLPAFRRLRVALLSSGDEVVQPGTSLRLGQCYDSNRYTLFALLTNLGCEILDLGTIADEFVATKEALTQAAHQADVVITSGGVSVGEEDHIKQAVEEVGQLALWKVAVKPGKPLAYGRIFDADFIGLPGNPVSVLVTFCLFVRPMLLHRQGAIPSFPTPRLVTAGFTWSRPGDRREYARARLLSEGKKGMYNEPRAVLFQRQGSDVLSSAVWADGLVEIPAGATIAVGDKLSYLSFAELLG